ncbi:MAG TPA: MlaD family protein [Chitinophagales bacterium]|nr:MlaD family protein [Chitinophagales bacterium]
MFRVPNEFKVGVVATIAIVLAVLGYNLLRGKNSFNRDRIYFAKYDHVDGLALAAHVRYNGMNVGRVQDMELATDGSGKIIMSMNVSPALKIPRGSVAKIVQIDLFGTRAVQIELSHEKEILQSGDTLQSGAEKDVISGVKDQAKALLGSLDTVVTSVREIFDDQTRTNLQKSFASVQHTLDNLDKSISSNQGRLDRIFSNIESITYNVNQNKEQITAILTNLNAISDSLRRANIAQTITQAHDALQQVSEVMKKINEGKGSMGLLVNDERLYNRLDSASTSLDALLKDFKQHPGHYVQFSVFGKKDKKESPSPR